MTLLEVSGLNAFYGDLQVIYDLDFTVGEKESVALLGANGAGKSTFLRSLVGLLDSRIGTVRFAGGDISNAPAESIARLGLGMVPEGRMLFDSLTVEENLLMGALNKRSGSWTLRRVFDLFPILEQRRNVLPGKLSGGQQQMVAIGRALMSNPRLLLCDEISLGLAPIVVRDIFQRLPIVIGEGTAVVVVEQDVMQALAASNYLYCLQEGRVLLKGESQSLNREAIKAPYFG